MAAVETGLPIDATLKIVSMVIGSLRFALRMPAACE